MPLTGEAGTMGVDGPPGPLGPRGIRGLPGSAGPIGKTFLCVLISTEISVCGFYDNLKTERLVSCFLGQQGHRYSRSCMDIIYLSLFL